MELIYSIITIMCGQQGYARKDDLIPEKGQVSIITNGGQPAAAVLHIEDFHELIRMGTIEEHDE